MYSFEEIYGNTQIIKSLQNSIKTGKVSHGYIFEGQHGIGKTLLAKTFAKTLLCQKQGIDTCETCPSCKTFNSNNNPDIFYISATKTKKIGIDDIREQLVKNMETMPFIYSYKIFIIEKADTMTTEAQNALLKTFEEPPSYGVILLLSENSNLLLPTIRSRAVTIKLKPLPNSQVYNYLKDNVSDSSKIGAATSFARGSIGQAIEICNDEEFNTIREKTINWFSSLKLSNADIVSTLQLSKEIESYKDNIQRILDIAIIYYRDILISKQEDTRQFIIQQDKSDFFSELSSKYTYSELYNNIQGLTDSKKKLTFYSNTALTLEMLLININSAVGGHS